MKLSLSVLHSVCNYIVLNYFVRSENKSHYDDHLRCSYVEFELKLCDIKISMQNLKCVKEVSEQKDDLVLEKSLLKLCWYDAKILVGGMSRVQVGKQTRGS